MREEFAYLAVTLDAFSRRVIGWALDAHVQASLAIAALKMAIGARGPGPGSLIHHKTGLPLCSGGGGLHYDDHEQSPRTAPDHRSLFKMAFHHAQYR